MLNSEQKQIPIQIDDILRDIGYDIPVTQTPEEGNTFTAPTNSQNLRTPQEQTSLILDSRLENACKIPESFDWRKVINKNTGRPVIQPAVPQIACGFCFCIGCVQTLSDRLSIKSLKQCPYLSGTYVMTCSRDGLTSNACAGGSALGAAKFLETTGTINYSCAPFDWCSQTAQCYSGTGSSAELNTFLPECKSFAGGSCNLCISTQCLDTTDNVSQKKYRALPGSTTILSHIDNYDQTICNMKQDIILHGPIVATFRVPLDFILVSTPRGKFPGSTFFSQTKGIYVNVPNVDQYNVGSYNGSLASMNIQGNHTISIVGFGIERGVQVKVGSVASTASNASNVSNANASNAADIPHTITIDLPYWIVRNSWSSNWGRENGFVKIAQTLPNFGINVQLGLDVPLKFSFPSEPSAATLSGGTSTPEMSQMSGATSTQSENPATIFGGGFSFQPSEETIALLKGDTKLINVDIVDGNPVTRESIIAGATSTAGTRGSLSSPGSATPTTPSMPIDPWIISSIVLGGLTLIIIVIIVSFVAIRPR